MNIYDFDNTIYKGDTNTDLIKYSFLRHPFSVSCSLIRSSILYRKYKRKEISFGDVKEVMLSFLFKIDNLDEYLDKFVDSHINKIKKWYLNQQKEDDTIMSASYEIWINKFCKRLNIKNIIATKTDENGKIVGSNCKGEEKVKRFEELFPGVKPINSYSDSRVDIPMLEYAEHGYVVKDEEIIPYHKGYKFK
jgi:HAD superfamily phosphoserine phosphatase-like hydrolase